MNSKIKRLIDKSGKKRYQLSKETEIPLTTLDRWYLGKQEASVALIKLLRHVSKSDKELIENIDVLLKKGDIKMENVKSALLEKGINRTDVSFIIGAIYDFMSNQHELESNISYDFTIINDIYNVSFEYKELYDEVEEEATEEYKLIDVVIYDFEKLLKDNDVEYKLSSNSNSVYAKIKGKEYRLSDHKRPKVVDGFAVYEQEYENEITFKTKIELYEIILKLL